MIKAIFFDLGDTLVVEESVGGKVFGSEVAEAQGGFRQKYCRELQAGETCTLTYREPIKDAPV